MPLALLLVCALTAAVDEPSVELGARAVSEDVSRQAAAQLGPPASNASQPSGLGIRLNQETGAAAKSSFEIIGLAAADLAQISRTNLDSAQWASLFAVYVGSEDRLAGRDRPALLGTYSVQGGVIRFEPRFPLQRGLRYRAVFDPSRLPDTGWARSYTQVIEKDFILPKPPLAATTLVERVYPTRRTLPENQLKFYLHFSAPMGRGRAYEHIHLLDASGKRVDLPFLELDEELWDPAVRRLTLLFDPGRIKTGLRPREEVGPVLERGKRYTLVIDKGWTDAQGNPLKESFRKEFTVGPPDETQPKPRNWTVISPFAGSRSPITLTFPEPLDQAMLQRVIRITDSRSKLLRGEISLEAEETRWLFVPESPWQPGTYSLVIETTLEDLAGNSIARPFEVDVFHPIQRRVEASTVKLPFEVRPKPSRK